MLDVVLFVLLVVAALIGYRRGLIRTAALLLGMVLGAVIAFMVIPLVSARLPAGGISLTVIPLTVVLCLALGSTIASIIGNVLRQGVQAIHIGMVDRLVGAAAHVALLAIIMAMVGASLSTLGNPEITIPVTNSRVITGVNRALPAGLRRQIAVWQTSLTQSGLPRLIDTINGETTEPGLPEDTGETTGQVAAAKSVVRITGLAPACSSVKAGSGVVIAKNRVITNAHVVAGVDEPVVQTTSGGSVRGRVVIFDPVRDVAVIATDTLNVPTLRLDSTPAGDSAVIQGFPYGGPFASEPASVMSTANAKVSDIYGKGSYTRSVETLATQVSPGNSGGPVLDGDGDVIGLVFARNKELSNVGYALSYQEIASAANNAANQTAQVDTQSCRIAE